MNSIRCGLLAAAALCVMISPAPAEELPLWQLYENTFKSAKYIDLTHPFAPVQPVWPGFGTARVKPAVAGPDPGERKSGVKGKGWSVRVDLGGSPTVKKTKPT